MRIETLLAKSMIAATLAFALALCGCTAPAGGGGGGGGGDGGGGNDNGAEDPLPEYQLGQGDEELDANVGVVTTADNQAVECLGLDVQFEDGEVLLALKTGYAAEEGPEAEFPEFVAQTAALEAPKADEICNTTLENASAELLDLVQRLTASGNAAATCLGEPADITDEDSLGAIKREFFGRSVNVYPTMTEFADAFVTDAEQAVDADCP